MSLLYKVWYTQDFNEFNERLAFQATDWKKSMSQKIYLIDTNHDFQNKNLKTSEDSLRAQHWYHVPREQLQTTWYLSSDDPTPPQK